MLFRSCDQSGRFDQVSHPAWVHDDLGPRQVREQSTGATGMIKVDVRQENVIDSLGTQTRLAQRSEQKWDCRRSAGIDEGRPAVMHNKVTGIESGAHILSIDRPDTVTNEGDPGDNRAGLRRPVEVVISHRPAEVQCGAFGTHSEGD